MTSRHRFMAEALKQAYKNLAGAQGGPFGACIVKNGKIIAAARNTVLNSDATCHAEINAIRMASAKVKSFDLSGCEIYSTTEPCPMCFSAIHWARIKAIYYGTDIKNVAKLGFNELAISNRKIKTLAGIDVKINGGFMKKQCRKLLESWAAINNRKVY